MFRNKSVSTHEFAMIPKADIPRSSFRMQKALKTTFDAGALVPMFCEEVLPGDTFSLKLTAFCRMATPIYPVMDNLHYETFFFFVPNRLVWDNWERFMGAQDDPGDSTSYLVPQVSCPADGYLQGSIFDYFGLPVKGQVAAGEDTPVNALPLRAYNRIYNEWFRDENLVDSLDQLTGDGPDSHASYDLARRGKRKDYFTGALPFLQKGPAVQLPLGSIAPVHTGGTDYAVTGAALKFKTVTGGAPGNFVPTLNSGVGLLGFGGLASGGLTNFVEPVNLFADLSAATAATINQLRQAFQIQKLLERDARGGTRYTEIVRSHFGVVSPDARLQRPEYLGGGSSPININPVAQTSATSVSGSDTPIATLSAFGTMVAHGHGFTQSFVEHGYVIGLMNVRADLTYQQGLRRHWSRRTRYDFYFPAFAMLGEQAVLQKEIWCRGNAGDDTVFGYQERWAEYRYMPSEISGLFRSYASGTLDPWHFAQYFATAPVLDDTFIGDRTDVVLQRNLAVGEDAGGQQFLFDGFFDVKAARPMPMYSVPGLIDHF